MQFKTVAMYALQLMLHPLPVENVTDRHAHWINYSGKKVLFRCVSRKSLIAEKESLKLQERGSPIYASFSIVVSKNNVIIITMNPLKVVRLYTPSVQK